MRAQNNLETFLRENDTYPSQSSKEKEEKALYRWYYDCKKKLYAWEKKKPERVTKMNKYIISNSPCSDTCPQVHCCRDSVTEIASPRSV